MNNNIKIFWGDIHNHCNISYGHGSLEYALKRARQQLDFCSVTGHAFWHDIPTGNKVLEKQVNIHQEGFKKLKNNWTRIQKILKKFNSKGKFLTFPSYEWHSSKYGDYCIYFPDYNIPLLAAGNIKELQNTITKSGGIIIPHHTGYKKGHRGLDWEYFNEDVSPLIELFSMHGCAESDLSPYPYLHIMGPRDYHGTAEFGLKRGLKFGFIASSDHHHAYPGSWGDGRMAIYAQELNKNSIWESMLRKRSYAVTGDKIKVFYSINDSLPGDLIECNKRREISLKVETEDYLDKIELIKNGKTIKYFIDTMLTASTENQIKLKFRIEWGWGFRDKEIKWQGDLKIHNGEIISAEPCFKGRPILDPEDSSHLDIPLPHKIETLSKKNCSWTSITRGNPTTRHENTQAIIFKVLTGPNGKIIININNIKQSIFLKDILEGSHTFYTKKTISEAIKIHRAIPEKRYNYEYVFEDNKAEKDMDYYFLRISQKNNQWAWITPIWVAS